MAHEPVTAIEHGDDRPSLVDCYRLALDFGLPAAQRALEHLSRALPEGADLPGSAAHKKAD